jgi:hypothetical protein
LDQFLQIVAVAALVTDGFGLTVTVIVKAAPIHVPVGRSRSYYIPFQLFALLGFVGLLMVAPEPAVAW